MDETYIKMCKEAKEIQRGMDGLNKDELNFLWSEGYHVYIKFDDIDCCLKRLKTPISENLSEFKIPRQEDLQEIFQEAHGNGIHVSTVVNSFYRWFWDEYNNKQKDCCEQYDWNVLWLCFVMDRLYGKRWNSKTGSWEVIT